MNKNIVYMNYLHYKKKKIKKISETVINYNCI